MEAATKYAAVRVLVAGGVVVGLLLHMHVGEECQVDSHRWYYCCYLTLIFTQLEPLPCNSVATKVTLRAALVQVFMYWVSLGETYLTLQPVTLSREPAQPFGDSILENRLKTLLIRNCLHNWSRNLSPISLAQLWL